MRVGVYTHYTQRESTWMALQLADSLQQYGPVSVRTDDKVRPLCPEWDAAVIASNKRKFTEWAKAQDAILWCCPGNTAQVRWASTHLSGAYALYTEEAWQRDSRRGCAKLHAYRVVYCIQGALDRLRKLSPRATFCPVKWSTQQTLTLKQPAVADPPTLVVPLVHGAAQYASSHMWHALDYVLRGHTTVQITVLYDLASKYTRQRVAKLSAKYPRRVTLLRTPTRDAVLNQFEHATITWIPTMLNPLGLVALWSLSVGTPVFAFDIAPYNSFVSTDQNGWLAIREPITTAMLGTVMQPTYMRMATQLVALLHRPQRIRETYARVNDGLQNRRAVFDHVWRAAFGDRKVQ